MPLTKKEIFFTINVRDVARYLDLKDRSFDPARICLEVDIRRGQSSVRGFASLDFHSNSIFMFTVL